MDTKIKMNEPQILKVKPGYTVLVGKDEIAKVLSFVGGAKNQIPQHFFTPQTLIQAKLNLYMVRK